MTQTVDQSFVLQFLREKRAAEYAALFSGFKPGRHHKLVAEKLEAMIEIN